MPSSLRLALLFGALAARATAASSNVSSHLCAVEQAAPNTDGEYIFNNNAWGADGSGASCTDVINDGASFETIWSWANNGNDTHGFPNVQLNTLLFPLQMTNLSEMNLQASWTMTPNDGVTRANVVYDMFVDPDKTVASGTNSTVQSKYEIMIWIGAYGDPFPLGASVNPFTGSLNSSLPSVALAGTTFQLYSGENTDGQTVHSWLALENQSDFSADVMPLINYLTNNSLVESDAFMGILQFGSETWHSAGNITFDVASFNLNVTSTDAAANAKASAAISGSSSSTTTSTAPSSTSSSSGSNSGSSSASGTPSSSAPSTTTSTSEITITTSTGRPLSTSSSPSLTTVTQITQTTVVPSLTPTAAKSGSSIVSLPFWFWEIVAAAGLFALL